jgi:hypothetical protein
MRRLMLKVHETTGPTGALVPIYLRFDESVLAMVEGEEAFPLPEGALDAIMKRYGAPLDPAAGVTSIGALDLGCGRQLRCVRHLARYDVIARDYLVYETAHGEPLCALATTVTGALAYLGRAVRAAGAP